METPNKSGGHISFETDFDLNPLLSGQNSAHVFETCNQPMPCFFSLLTSGNLGENSTKVMVQVGFVNHVS